MNRIVTPGLAANVGAASRVEEDEAGVHKYIEVAVAKVRSWHVSIVSTEYRARTSLCRFFLPPTIQEAQQ